VVGAEERLDPVLFAGLPEGEPVRPGHALLALDHQRQPHRASYGGGVEGLIFAGVGAATTAVSPFPRPMHSAPSRDVSGDVHRLLFANGSSLALVPPDYVEPPSDTLLGFLVDDVEAAHGRAAPRRDRAGRRADGGYGFRYRTFQAPDGRRFELLDRRL
jgi:hypothetical protein